MVRRIRQPPLCCVRSNTKLCLIVPVYQTVPMVETSALTRPVLPELWCDNVRDGLQCCQTGLPQNPPFSFRESLCDAVVSIRSLYGFSGTVRTSAPTVSSRLTNLLLRLCFRNCDDRAIGPWRNRQLPSRYRWQREMLMALFWEAGSLPTDSSAWAAHSYIMCPI